MQKDFFLDDIGVKVELVSTEDLAVTAVIQMQLRVVDPKKRKDKHKENEAIQFDYDISKDNADEVAQEMVSDPRRNL